MLKMLLSLVLLTPPASAADLGWMAGCWSLDAAGRSTREQWMPPSGGTLLGMARTVAGGETVEYEFLVIREGPQGLEYAARPSGQKETVFTAAGPAKPGEVVFVNPAHDFPTRIRYVRDGDRLTATIDGTIGGAPREITFAYRSCAG